MSSQSAECGMKKCPLVGFVKKEDFKNISAHRWEFHMFDDERSCRIQTCPEFGTVANDYATYKAHLDAHHQDKYKGVLSLCPVKDCPMRERKVNFKANPQLKLHQWDCHLPIEKKSCQITDCPQFGILQGNRTKLLDHWDAHQQGMDLFRKRKPERKGDDSSEGEDSYGSVSNSPCLQTFH
jgi:hypothetical protein